MLQKLVATIFSNDVLVSSFLVHSDHSPEVGTCANPQIADSSFYLRICGGKIEIYLKSAKQ